MTLGTRADLARKLGISRAAVTAALKKHELQQSIDGKFDIDYYAYLLREKQNKARIDGQAMRKEKQLTKQPAITTPIMRIAVGTLAEVFDRAVIETLKDYSDDNDIDIEIVLDHLYAFLLHFRNTFNTAYPPGIVENEITMPSTLQKLIYAEGNYTDVVKELLGDQA